MKCPDCGRTLEEGPSDDPGLLYEGITYQWYRCEWSQIVYLYTVANQRLYHIGRASQGYYQGPEENWLDNTGGEYEM